MTTFEPTLGFNSCSDCTDIAITLFPLNVKLISAADVTAGLYWAEKPSCKILVFLLSLIEPPIDSEQNSLRIG